MSLLNCTIEPGEKGNKSTGENSEQSSGDGTLKLQISVPCHGRTCPDPFFWEKLNRGVSKPGGFPLSSGKVQIEDESGKSPDHPRANLENPRKFGKGQKRTKKEGRVQIGKRPRLKPPRLAAFDF